MEFSANAQVLNDIDVRMGIFRGNTVSPLTFDLYMIPMKLILKKTRLAINGKKTVQNKPAPNHGKLKSIWEK